MVENMINMSFRTTYSPEVPGGRAESYELCPMLTYSIAYWEVYRRFQGRFFLVGGGGVGGYMGGSLYEGRFHGRWNIAMKGAPDFPALLKKEIRN